MIKAYLLSLGVGLLVGLIYGGLGVKSPAPPVIALIGLFGMLAGEQIVPIVRNAFAGRTVFEAGASADLQAGAPRTETDA